MTHSSSFLSSLFERSLKALYDLSNLPIQQIDAALNLILDIIPVEDGSTDCK
jgi:hypothetical protein